MDVVQKGATFSDDPAVSDEQMRLKLLVIPAGFCQRISQSFYQDGEALERRR